MMTDAEKLDCILHRLDDVNARLERMEQILQDVHGNSTKMTSHVDFVENVYEKVQSPFHSLMNFTDQYLAKNYVEYKNQE